jgi:hypothetical protein
MGYVAFVLDEESRSRLLKTLTPEFPDVICHHITLEFGVNPLRLPVIIEEMASPIVNIRGVARGDNVEALIVSINNNSIRSDGGFYHITHSLDRSKGAKPVHSNDVVNDVDNWNLLRGMFFVTGSIQYFN